MDWSLVVAGGGKVGGGVPALVMVAVCVAMMREGWDALAGLVVQGVACEAMSVAFRMMERT